MMSVFRMPQGAVLANSLRMPHHYALFCDEIHARKITVDILSKSLDFVPFRLERNRK